MTRLFPIKLIIHERNGNVSQKGNKSTFDGEMFRKENV